MGHAGDAAPGLGDDGTAPPAPEDMEARSRTFSQLPKAFASFPAPNS